MGARWGKPLRQRSQGMTPHPPGRGTTCRWRQRRGGEGGGTERWGPAGAARSARSSGRAVPSAPAPLTRSLTPGVGARRAPGGARLPLAPGPPAAPRHGSAPAAARRGERRARSPQPPAAFLRLFSFSPPRSGAARPGTSSRPRARMRCCAAEPSPAGSSGSSSGQGCSSSSPFCAALTACLLPRRARPPSPGRQRRGPPAPRGTARPVPRTKRPGDGGSRGGGY